MWPRANVANVTQGGCDPEHQHPWSCKMCIYQSKSTVTLNVGGWNKGPKQLRAFVTLAAKWPWPFVTPGKYGLGWNNTSPVWHLAYVTQVVCDLPSGNRVCRSACLHANMACERSRYRRSLFLSRNPSTLYVTWDTNELVSRYPSIIIILRCFPMSFITKLTFSYTEKITEGIDWI